MLIRPDFVAFVFIFINLLTSCNWMQSVAVQRPPKHIKKPNSSIMFNGKGFWNISKYNFQFEMFRLQFLFRTKEDKGLIAFGSGEADVPTFLLYLTNTGVELSIQKRGDPEHMDFAVSINQNVSDSKWHMLSMILMKEGKQLILDDNIDKAQSVRWNYKFSSYTNIPFVTFGATESETLSTRKCPEIFFGCIGDVSINDQTIEPNDKRYKLQGDVKPGCPWTGELRIGERCLSEEDCEKNLVCKSNICSCPDNHVVSSNHTCLSTKRLGEKCDSNEQCIFVNQNSACSVEKHICVCCKSFMWSDVLKRCVKKGELEFSDKCSENDDCALKFCNKNNRCSCPDNARLEISAELGKSECVEDNKRDCKETTWRTVTIILFVIILIYIL
ncbi:uncharacterized protein LOC111087267 isoform X2 [Limulus polyphemus]|nr:uncharacterized protein LOC111087267 isoform X2 [Limulus polyphemus]